MYSQWPLTPGAGQFRVLVLHPPSTGGGNDQLHGSLVVANLKHEKGRFETLSYVWGSSNLPRATILVDRTSLQITASLGSFLRYLRRNDRPLRLWADGICINQEDDEEKSEQVALMADIYKSYSQVNVWLPDPTYDVGSTPRHKNVSSLRGLFSLMAGDHFHDVPGYHVYKRTRRLKFTETAEFDAL
ncbi:unnamed protein product [Colletotrichum noveboracense]|uniref:Heterokaryon incompatibility domain-containing protein n=1 Tax=Colletotrichum noveboracense TaxID=2664923 RepID=A0A9W4S667_9PEZI|nr:unnamed protein product [Colletotrichum noveboracense]